MRLAVCHYSYHRRWKEEGWDAVRLAEEVKAAGAEGIDFHAGLLGSPDGAAGAIRGALEKTGLTLSGLSLSNNFNQADAAELRKQVESVNAWLDVAEEVGAPVCRIFGGHVENRADPDARREGMPRILEGLRAVVPEAEKRGLVLALENHGGLPCLGEEQVEVIEKIASPALRATVDVGNYMQGGQEGTEGARAAANHAGYVHVKDNRKKLDNAKPWGWTTEACVVGRGDVDIPGCLRILGEAGYDGFLALEYEGADPEKTGVPESLAYLAKMLREL